MAEEQATEEQANAELVVGSVNEGFEELPMPGQVILDLRDERSPVLEMVGQKIRSLERSVNMRRFLAPEPLFRAPAILSIGPLYVVDRKPIEAMFDGYRISKMGQQYHEIITHHKRMFKKPDDRIAGENAFFIEKHSLGNYFHWVTEGLPRLALILSAGKDLGIEQIVVNSGNEAALGFKLESLKTHFPELADKVVLNSRRRIWGYNSVCGTSASLSHFYAAREGKRQKNISGRGSRLTTATREFAELAADRSRVPDSVGYKRILISRADAPTRKISNEDEVFAALEPLGFTRIRASEFNHAEQVSIFRNAEVVVGAHGAGLANLIFCTPGAKVFEITNRQYLNRFYSFIDLSILRKLDYKLLVVDEEGDKPVVERNVGNDIKMSRKSISALIDLVQAA